MSRVARTKHRIRDCRQQDRSACHFLDGDVVELAVCHEYRLGTTVHNCTRDGGGPFEFGSQVLISSHRKLLSSKAMVVSVAETAGHDPVRQG
jgi:hypothetical protein